MKPLKAIVHGMNKETDRRVVIEIGPPTRDGVDILLLDCYGGLYWAAASGYEVIGPTEGDWREWLDPFGNLPENANGL